MHWIYTKIKVNDRCTGKRKQSVSLRKTVIYVAGKRGETFCFSHTIAIQNNDSFVWLTLNIDARFQKMNTHGSKLVDIAPAYGIG